MQAEAANATSNRATVLAAIQNASQTTGADFDYMLGTAMRESSLKPTAKASTSSASGLYQFVDQTWLGMIKNYGAKYGLGSYADAISQGSNGRYRVTNSADRSAILALRNDPKVASLMEGEYAQASRATLQGALGRNVCSGELYAAHFLGNDSACRLIKLNDSNPNANAAHAFPAAADANWKVFHHADGTAKSVREVYSWAMKQTDVEGASTIGALAPSATSGAIVTGAVADMSGNAAILAGLTSWRPQHGFFANDAKDGSSPATPFLLTPAVMDVLSSLDTVALNSPNH